LAFAIHNQNSKSLRKGSKPLGRPSRFGISGRAFAAVRDPFGLRALKEQDGQPIRLPQRYRPSDAFLGWHGRRFGFA